MLVIVPFDGLRKTLPDGTILLFDGTYAAPLRFKRPANKFAGMSLIVHAHRMNDVVSEVYGH
jgi:hypothetical protein